MTTYCCEGTETKVREFHRHLYIPAPSYHGAYTVKGWGNGIAWNVLGWEQIENEDTEWSGYTVHSGDLLCVMVGDDRIFVVPPENLTKLGPSEYCHSCGQVGCGCDADYE